MKISRRNFMTGTALALANAAVTPGARAGKRAEGVRREELPLIVSTWPFGKASNDRALEVINEGGSLLDAVEKGIWVTESDFKNKSVGLSGTPNAAGVVQLDACIMAGPGHRAGSVAAIEGVPHPISAARLVMEKTPNVMLVGEGARMFAIEQGLETVEVDSARLNRQWLQKQLRKKSRPKRGRISEKNHDTIALLILGADGNIAGGCSTSGLGHKLPGRVGDSPIPGDGLYVDNEVGAAGSTGLGENVMRYCATYMVVDFMRQGMHPTEACRETILHIAREDPRKLNLNIYFVALDKNGRYGAAGVGKGFSYSVTTRRQSRVLRSAAVNKL